MLMMIMMVLIEVGLEVEPRLDELHVSKSVLIMLMMVMMVLIEVGLEVEPGLDELMSASQS